MVSDNSQKRQRSKWSSQAPTPPHESAGGECSGWKPGLLETTPCPDASADAEGLRECGEAATAEGMGLSVTPHAPVSFSGLSLEETREAPEAWQFLICGFDTLDLGLHIDWPPDWSELADSLEKGRAKAAGTTGIPWVDAQLLIMPGGKTGGYRWHLEGQHFHLWLADRETPLENTPNVYVSLKAKFLWTCPLHEVIRSLDECITDLGGRLRKIVPSRCDMTADFQIAGGLSAQFIETHLVSTARKNSQYRDGSMLETFYIGAKSSPVQLRLYNKTREILDGNGEKLWFKEIWNLASCDNVWRVEFQLRRTLLREFGIHNISDLEARAGGVWDYLTTQFCSLRRPDNPNVSRRTTHPFWTAVCECGPLFGPVMNIQRDLSNGVSDASVYVSRAAGCLAGYAARRRIPELDEALVEFASDIQQHWNRRGDFDQEYGIRSIKLGHNPANSDPGGNSLPEVEAA